MAKIIQQKDRDNTELYPITLSSAVIHNNNETVEDALKSKGNAKIFYGTCSTAAGTATKDVVCTDFTQNDLKKGALLFVTFDKTNTANPTSLKLNVNSTGAKFIRKLNQSGSIIDLNKTELALNQTYLFQYDNTRWVCLTTDRSQDQTIILYYKPSVSDYLSYEYIGSTFNNSKKVSWEDFVSFGVPVMVINQEGTHGAQNFIYTGSDESYFYFTQTVGDDSDVLFKVFYAEYDEDDYLYVLEGFDFYLQKEITSSNPLSSDIVSDTNRTNKFVRVVEFTQGGTSSAPTFTCNKTISDICGYNNSNSTGKHPVFARIPITTTFTLNGVQINSGSILEGVLVRTEGTTLADFNMTYDDKHYMLKGTHPSSADVWTIIIQDLAVDSNVVHTSGTETITGLKTFDWDDNGGGIVLATDIGISSGETWIAKDIVVSKDVKAENVDNGSDSVPNLGFIKDTYVPYYPSSMLKLTSLATVPGFGINGYGGKFASSGLRIVRYNVTEGDTIYIQSKGNYVFQNQQSEPQTGTSNSAKIGDVCWANYGKAVVVPQGAICIWITTLNSGDTFSGVWKSDMATIRSGAALGATAYQKPSGGIPSTDLASAVQTSLDKADAAANDTSVLHKATDETITGTKTAHVIDDFKFALSETADTILLPSSSNTIAYAPVQWNAWHDHFAFLRTHTCMDVQYSTDGTSWVSSDVDLKPLFILKESSSTTILRASDLAFRFTLNASNFHTCQVWWFLIGFSYSSSSCRVNVLIEQSVDKENWTEIFYGNVSAVSNTVLLKNRYINSMINVKYVRFTFTKATNTTTAIVNVNSICALTMRKGNQGVGKEHQFPYDWNSTPDIYPINTDTSNLGIDSKRWANVNSVLGNFSGAVTASSFVKSNGTSSQFLKADGSIDSTSYADDSNVVHKTGNETIAGSKTFKNAISIDSNSMGIAAHIAFNRAGWNYISVPTNGAFAIANGSGGTNSFFCVDTLNKLILPGYKDNTMNIGSSSFRWKNLYLSGSINNGTYLLSLPNKSGTIATTDITLADLETATTSHPAEDDVLKSGINRLFIIPLGSKTAGWYRVAKLGIRFSGFVTIDGVYYSAMPTHATFAISARPNDAASDIIQLSGSAGVAITKIRLVSNESGDHMFYLDVYKGNNNNCNNQGVMISGDFYALENAWTGTAIDVVDTYIRKECTIRTITGELLTTTSREITASKLGSSTVGSSTMPVYLNEGTPTAISSFPEAYLSWGGRNFSGNYGCIDAAMVSELGAPRTMFAKAAGIVVEYSTDGGETWLDYGANNTQKVLLFSTGYLFTIGKNTVNGGGSANHMLRVTLRTASTASSIYTILNKFVIYVSTNGSTGCYCTIRCRTQLNYEDNVDTWILRADKVPISGWSGYNVINIANTPTYGITKSNQYGEIQFIFGCTGFSGNYAGLNIQKIFGFGGVGWTCPSTMAKTGHLYSFDASQNATFPAGVKATGPVYVMPTGTTSRYWSSSSNSDMFATIGTATPLVLSTTVVRRGSSDTTVDLGTSTYPWNGIYGKTFNANNGLTIDGNSISASNNNNLTLTASHTPDGVATPDVTNSLVISPTSLGTATLGGNTVLTSGNAATVATTGNYNDLSNKPTNVSDFTNDANYVTSTQLSTSYYNKTEVDNGVSQMLGNYYTKTEVDGKNYLPISKVGVANVTCTASGPSRGVSLTGYTLAAGNIVSVKFTQAITTSTSLSIQGTGGKTMKYNGSNLISGIIGAGDTVILCYDGSYYNVVHIDKAVDLSTKQDTLVSGTNIKTVNGNSLLGSGNITIQGGSGGGTGDVTGPSSSTNNNIVVFDGTGGKAIKDSGVNILALGDIVGSGTSISGNFACYTDATGKIIEDSGYSASDFVSSAQLAGVVNGTTRLSGVDILETGKLKFSDYDTGSWRSNDSLSWGYVNPDNTSDGKGLVCHPDLRLEYGKVFKVTGSSNVGLDAFRYNASSSTLQIGDSEMMGIQTLAALQDKDGLSIRGCKYISCSTIISGSVDTTITTALMNSIVNALSDYPGHTYFYNSETYNMGTSSNVAMKFPVKVIRRNNNQLVFSYEYSPNSGTITTKYVEVTYNNSVWKISNIKEVNI